MCAWQPARLDRDRTNLGEAASVGTVAVVENVIAESALFQQIEEARCFGTFGRIILRIALDDALLECVDGAVAGNLRLCGDIERGTQIGGELLFELAKHRFVVNLRRVLALRDSERLEHRALELAELADLAVCKHQRLDHDALTDLFRSGFDHADRFFASGDDQVEERTTDLLVGRVDDIFAIDESDTNAGDRVMKRNVRKIECG